MSTGPRFQPSDPGMSPGLLAITEQYVEGRIDVLTYRQAVEVEHRGRSERAGSSPCSCLACRWIREWQEGPVQP